MSLYLYAAILFTILGAVYWLYRRGYNIGYRKGVDDANKEWNEKMATIDKRLGDAGDSGAIVRDGSVWKSPSPKS